MDEPPSTTEPPSEPAEPRPSGRHTGAAANAHKGSPSGAAIELADPHGLLDAAQREELSRMCACALEVLNTTGSVRAKLVADTEMAAAHEQYSNVPGTTDVLTFDMSENDNGACDLDVDLLICVDEACRQVAQRGHPVTHELTLYIVHGVLHCLGFDDHTDEDARAIHAEEDRVLSAIGIGRVYSGEREGAGA